MYYIIEKVCSNRKSAESRLKTLKDKANKPYVKDFGEGNFAVVLYETERHERAVEGVHHYFSKGIVCAIHKE